MNTFAWIQLVVKVGTGIAKAVRALKRSGPIPRIKQRGRDEASQALIDLAKKSRRKS